MLEVNEHVLEILDLDMYDKEEAAGTLSATTLCRSAREIILIERYGDVANPDEPMAKAWSTMGSLVHLALEILSRPTGFKGLVHRAIAFMKKWLHVESAEERLKFPWMGEMISGKYDFVKKIKGKLYMSDYKVTGTYGIKKNPYGKLEWVRQLSINRWLYSKTKKIVLEDVGHIYLFLRDWAKRFVKVGGPYPNVPIGCLPIGLMSFEDTEKFLTGKVQEIQRCRLLPDEKLPPCEDTWQGRKCEGYCLVRDYCNKKGIEGISV